MWENPEAWRSVAFFIGASVVAVVLFVWGVFGSETHDD